MRTISQEHVFTVSGTVLIMLVFSAMGAAAALAAWWRRNPRHPRGVFVRAVGVLPFALLGPFTLLFIPSFLTGLVASHAGWRWARRVALALGVLFLGLTELVLLTMDDAGSGWVRVASGILYLPLAYAVFVAIRLAFDPFDRSEHRLAAG
jgi:MFS family permease